LSGYPLWVLLDGGGRFGNPEHARAYAQYLKTAAELNEPELQRVAEAARYDRGLEPGSFIRPASCERVVVPVA
jgi:hypothetical protein